MVGAADDKPTTLLGISEDQLDASNIRALAVHERYASGAPITTADLVKRLAMVPLGPPTGKYSKPKGRYKIAGDSSEDDAAEEPPGSPAPEFFMASGPGLAGGAAGVRAAVTITARDVNRRRVRDGGQGAEVMVKVLPARPGGGGEPIIAELTDRGDGSYVAIYQVPEKGNYNVHIEVEGTEIDGSPYPVFFSAHDPNVAAAAAAETADYLAAVGAAEGAAGTDGAAVATAKAPKVIGAALGNNPAPAVAPPGTMVPPAAAAVAAAATAATAPMSFPGFPQVSNPAAYAAAVAAAQASASRIPYTLQVLAKHLATQKGPEVFSRCVVVFHFPGAQITADALKTIMGVTGSVKDAQVHAVGAEWLGFVEFATPEEAHGACGLTGTKVGDQAMQVVLAPPVSLQDVASANPLLALQMETIQKAQAAMAQQQALLAAMRAAIPVIAKRDGSRSRSRSRSRSKSRDRNLTPDFLKRRRSPNGRGGRMFWGQKQRSPPPRVAPRQRSPPSPPRRRRSPSPPRRRRTPSPRGHRGRGEPRLGPVVRDRDRDRRRSRSRSRSPARRRSREREPLRPGNRDGDRGRRSDRDRSGSRERGRGGRNDRRHRSRSRSKGRDKERERGRDDKRRRSRSRGKERKEHADKRSRSRGREEKEKKEHAGKRSRSRSRSSNLEKEGAAADKRKRSRSPAGRAGEGGSGSKRMRDGADADGEGANLVNGAAAPALAADDGEEQNGGDGGGDDADGGGKDGKHEKGKEQDRNKEGKRDRHHKHRPKHHKHKDKDRDKDKDSERRRGKERDRGGDKGKEKEEPEEEGRQAALGSAEAAEASDG